MYSIFKPLGCLEDLSNIRKTITGYAQLRIVRSRVTSGLKDMSEMITRP